jgi:hypothetical protein
MTVYRYHIPAFDVETIEEFTPSSSRTMLGARLPNGWDMWIPTEIVPELLPEPLPELTDGFYTMAGHRAVLKRYTYEHSGTVWYEWDGDEWAYSDIMDVDSEDSKIVRSILNKIENI